MKSAPRKYGTQRERSDVAQAKILEATVALIGERGVMGFSVTEVGERAGVGRALPGYHFKTSQALLERALAGLLEDEAEPERFGLASLLTWMNDQSQRAARRDPKLLALLQLAVGPGVDAEAPALRQTYWTRRSQLIQLHLNAAQARQVRDDLELSDLATVLLGLLHGELLRIAATGDASAAASAAFTALIERALAPVKPTTAKPPPKAPPPPGGYLFAPAPPRPAPPDPD